MSYKFKEVEPSKLRGIIMDADINEDDELVIQVADPHHPAQWETFVFQGQRLYKVKPA